MDDVIMMIDGDFFKMIEGTYDSEVCDCCGNHRLCDWWENIAFDAASIVGHDLCRRCSKELRGISE